MNYELWIMNYELWIMNHELWIMNYELWISELWISKLVNYELVIWNVNILLMRLSDVLFCLLPEISCDYQNICTEPEHQHNQDDGQKSFDIERSTDSDLFVTFVDFFYIIEKLYCTSFQFFRNAKLQEAREK